MNNGIAHIYESLNDNPFGGEQIKRLTDIGRAFFDYINIGVDDYHYANQEGSKIEVRIRILRNNKINAQNVIRINDTYYRIWRVRHGVNKSNVPITDITLITIENLQDEGGGEDNDAY